MLADARRNCVCPRERRVQNPMRMLVSETRRPPQKMELVAVTTVITVLAYGLQKAPDTTQKPF